jgi:hypothetical protein
MKKFLWLSLFLVILFLSGCNTADKIILEEQIPTPKDGMSTIYGRILSASQEPLSGIPVRLAKVYRGGEGNENAFFVLDEAQSPSTISENDGQFIFLDVEIGEYVIFVGRLHADYQIISESEDTPIVYEVGSGEILQIEPLLISFD